MLLFWESRLGRLSEGERGRLRTVACTLSKSPAAETGFGELKS